MFKRQLNLPGNTPAPGRNYIYIYYYIILYYIYYITLYIYIIYISGLDHPSTKSNLKFPTASIPHSPSPSSELPTSRGTSSSSSSNKAALVPANNGGFGHKKTGGSTHHWGNPGGISYQQQYDLGILGVPKSLGTGILHVFCIPNWL